MNDVDINRQVTEKMFTGTSFLNSLYKEESSLETNLKNSVVAGYMVGTVTKFYPKMFEEVKQFIR